MKSLKFKTAFLTLFFFLILISCSKDSENEKIPDPASAIEVFRSQLVIIDLKDTNLLMNEYDGVLGNTPIKLIKSEENRLLFLITNVTPIGLANLTIPALGNKSILYDVKEAILTETPEKTLESLIFNFNQSSQKLDNSQEGINAKKNILNFTNFLNKASSEEKKQLAILYKVNQSLFDNPFYENSNLSGKNIIDQLKLIVTFDKKVLLLGPAALMIYFGETLVKLAGVALATYAVYSAIKAHDRLQTESLESIDADLREAGIINKKELYNTNTSLNLVSNSSKTITINTQDRIVITNDRSNAKPAIVNFFKSQDSFNNTVAKMNTIIEWLNQNIPTISYSLFKILQSPSTAPLVLSPVDAFTFKNFKFSINHPNLILKNATYQSTGKMDLNIELTGTPNIVPIVSTLNYTYDDEFNTFSGTIPISVNKSFSILGSWKEISHIYCGIDAYVVPAGQSQFSSTCNSAIGGFDECLRDDLLIFKNNNTGVFDEGSTKCNASDPQMHSFNYLYNSDKETINIIFQNENIGYEILELNNTTLKLKIPGDKMSTIISTYQKQ